MREVVRPQMDLSDARVNAIDASRVRVNISLRQIVLLRTPVGRGPSHPHLCENADAPTLLLHCDGVTGQCARSIANSHILPLWIIGEASIFA